MKFCYIKLQFGHIRFVISKSVILKSVISKGPSPSCPWPELERVGAFPPCSPPRVELLSPHSVDARTQCQRARTLVCNFRIQGKFANTSLEGDTFARLVVGDVPNKFLQYQRTKMSSSGSSHRVPHSYSVPKGNGGKVVMEFVDKVYDQAPGFQVWGVLTFALLTLCVA